MCSAQDDAALPASGLPIRRSAGQWLFSASPRLIAAVHVLHRLLVPRHPPRALHILTVIRPTPRAVGPELVIPILHWPAMRFSRSGEARRRGLRRPRLEATERRNPR